MKQPAFGRLIIAMDGPAGSGKSSTANALARALRMPYIDTGAMYRSITFLAIREKADWSNAKRLAQIAGKADFDFKEIRGQKKVYVNGIDVTEAIRTPELTNQVHRVAGCPGVRTQMVKLQRRFGAKAGGVLEGRDIGTVVFPKADFKFYLDADFRLRAKRRQAELEAKGTHLPIKAIEKDLKARDRKDLTRKVGGLKPAKDAIRLDTTALTIDQTVDIIIRIISDRLKTGKTRKAA